MHVTIDKNAIRYSTCTNPRLVAKALDTGSAPNDPGWVEGYASIFDNLDFTAEIIKKGSFVDSFALVRAGAIPLMSKHFRDGGDAAEAIGTVIAAREDNLGLFTRAGFSTDTNAQQMRKKVLDKTVKYFSVGFYPVEWFTWPPQTPEEEAACEAYPPARNRGIVVYTKCRLGEVTVTVKPANERSVITAAKSFAGPPRKRGPTWHDVDLMKKKCELMRHQIRAIQLGCRID